MGQKVRDVMTKNPLTLPADATLIEAAISMRDANIGDVLVTKTKDGGELCGIVTDRDIVVRALADNKKPDKTKLDDICSEKMITISPDEELADAVRVMRDEKVRRIPVMENGKAIGVVSLGDLATTRDPRSALGEISAAPPNR